MVVMVRGVYEDEDTEDFSSRWGKAIISPECLSSRALKLLISHPVTQTTATLAHAYPQEHMPEGI